MVRTLDRKEMLKSIKILIADGDSCIARVLAQNLRVFGFSQLRHVRNGEQALAAMREKPVDLLITEWVMSPMDGPELVRYIRNDKDSPNRMLPIIMLTGKGEVMDVQHARDSGITEFVVKPFTAMTLFKRIEQIVDNPRGFVVCPVYVGPDRRRKGKPPEGEEERRNRAPRKTQSHSVSLAKPPPTPVIIEPAYELKTSIGLTGSLSTLITPQVLEEAQKAIEEMSDESMQWIKEDLAMLEEGYEALASSLELHALERVRDAALSMKSRAGTFGYIIASDVARLLYLFMTTDYDVAKPQHQVVLRKHIDTLKVIFASDMKGRDKLGEQVVAELHRLIAKQR